MRKSHNCLWLIVFVKYEARKFGIHSADAHLDRTVTKVRCYSNSATTIA